MIKAEDGTVELEGKGAEILSDFSTICAALFKHGIPFELLIEMMAMASAYVRDKDTDRRTFERIQKSFKRMSDKDKADLINALKEAVESDD